MFYNKTTAGRLDDLKELIMLRHRHIVSYEVPSEKWWKTLQKPWENGENPTKTMGKWVESLGKPVRKW